MTTYRIDGVKYNPANWADLDPSERAACNRFAAARERELNTITATPWTCHGGPFSGHTIELESTTEHSAMLTVGAWVGRYELQKHPHNPADSARELRWVGNDAGAPVNTHNHTTDAKKQASEVTARGFDQLRDLLADLAEDPTERATTTSAEGPTKPRARYTIGRTTYTIDATAEAADRLRARIVKAKRWFADKLLTAARSVQASPAADETTPDTAAIIAASVAIATAQAAAADHHADDAAELVTVDGPDHADDASTAPVVNTPTQTADAIGATDTPTTDDAADCTDPVETRASANDDTDPLKTPATGHAEGSRAPQDDASAAPVVDTPTKTADAIGATDTPTTDDAADCTDPVETLSQASDCTASVETPADPTTTDPAAALRRLYDWIATDDADPLGQSRGHRHQAQQGQRINSKTGAWRAAFYRIADRQQMAIRSADGFELVASFDTASERVRTLQHIGTTLDQTGGRLAIINATTQPETLATDCTEAPETLTAKPEAPAFQRAKPEHIDLRHLLAGGVTPSQMVGLGIHYTGDMANAGGEGAIVEATADNSRGVRVSVTLEDGRHMTHLDAYSFADRPGSRFALTAKVHGAPYLAELAAARAARAASEEAAKTSKAQHHAEELQRLAAEFPHLQRKGPNDHGGTFAARNVRIMLKAAFPGVKFSVTSDYNSIRVRWTDGPTGAQVDATIGRFDIGRADYCTDYFYTVSSAWSDLFGGVQYLFTNRDESPELLARVLEAYNAQYGTNATPDDWRKQAGPFGYTSRDGDAHRHWFRDMLNKTDAIPTKKTSRKPSA